MDKPTETQGLPKGTITGETMFPFSFEAQFFL